jgi:NADH dehydrogenase (ubiquinone) 1 alpha subcomplex subunit 9
VCHFTPTYSIAQTIVRPATLFGTEDRLLNWIAEAADILPVFPLIKNGSTLIQPVHAVDVASALMQIVIVSTSRVHEHIHQITIESKDAKSSPPHPTIQTLLLSTNMIHTGGAYSQRNEEFKGKTFQLTGPAEYSYKEVVEFVFDVTQKKRPLVDIPLPLANAAGSVFEQFINPFLSPDMIAQMCEDNVASTDKGLLTMKDLGIEPVSIDRVAFNYLHRFRAGGHFTKVEGYYHQKKAAAH